MIGKKFGNLIVESMAGRGPRGVSWLCLCTCGKRRVFSTTQLIGNGAYRSCGCGLNKSTKRQPVPKHLRIKFSSTVTCWNAMLARCHYAKNKQKCYENIEITDDWFSFENFLRDMGPRPSMSHGIDRKDPDKGYNKENCRWLLKKENSSRIRMNLSEERNRRVSEGLKKSYAEGRIVVSEEARRKIALGAIKRVGRKLRPCSRCQQKAYTKLCQRCREQLERVQKRALMLQRQQA